MEDVKAAAGFSLRGLFDPGCVCLGLWRHGTADDDICGAVWKSIHDLERRARGRRLIARRLGGGLEVAQQIRRVCGAMFCDGALGGQLRAWEKGCVEAWDASSNNSSDSGSPCDGVTRCCH